MAGRRLDVVLLAVALIGSPFAAVASVRPAAQPEAKARWIWADREVKNPKNRFTYFRKVVTLEDVPKDATLRFAADSTAQLWINGSIVRRKVARYHEPKITAEVVNAAPYLRRGLNTVVALHHNWGEIVTFQRTANEHAGLYLDSAWVRSDETWRCRVAPEFVAHEKQIVGVIEHPRIRYSVIVDGRRALSGDIHDPGFDDSEWDRAFTVEGGPWPAVPSDVETPGQREYGVRPLGVIAAGTAERRLPLSDDPHSMAAGIRTAICHPEEEAAREAGALLSGKPATITGRAGETHYLTFDFFRPVHGYPFLALAEAPAGTRIDLGYTEIPYAQYDGEWHVDPSGWINPEGVVGEGYSDRYVARDGAQSTEFPDERTARWLTVHIHFSQDGRVVLSDLGFVKSQYPIEPIGSFACGDERIDQIVKLCLIHAEVTMTDAYVDTPGREDGQWLEDDRPRALLAARWFGDTKLRELLIRTHAEGQGTDGQLHPFAPSNFPAYPATYDWSVQWVAALYDDYMWSGQTHRIERFWRNLTRYWENVLAHLDEDGLWRTSRVLADIRMGTSPMDDKQSSGMVTPWIIERLRWSAEMAEAIGEKQQAASWRTTSHRMARAFRKHHIVAARGEVPAHVGDRSEPGNPAVDRGYSQAGQTVAVLAGLLTPEEAVADLGYAFPDPDGSPPASVTRWNNPSYGYRVLRALSQADFHERAVRHLKERYAPYLPAHPRNPVPLVFQGPYGGPLPEYWVSREDLGLEPGEINSAQPNDETGSHGWGAVPLLWLHDTLLGVRITSPGGGTLRIAPRAAGLPFVAGHTVTPKGPIWVSWNPQRGTLDVEIPAGVEAEVVLPPTTEGMRISIARAAGEVQRRENNVFTIKGAGPYTLEVR